LLSLGRELKNWKRGGKEKKNYIKKTKDRTKKHIDTRVNKQIERERNTNSTAIQILT